MQPDLVAEFAEAYQQEVNRQRAGADAARERTSRELAQVERKLAGLVEAIANGLRAPSLQQTLDDLEQRRAELTETARLSAGATAAAAPQSRRGLPPQGHRARGGAARSDARNRGARHPARADRSR